MYISNSGACERSLRRIVKCKQWCKITQTCLAIHSNSAGQKCSNQDEDSCHLLLLKHNEQLHNGYCYDLELLSPRLRRLRLRLVWLQFFLPYIAYLRNGEMQPLLLLTLSLPIPLRLYTLPHWSNPPFLICDIRALWRSALSARAPECQKLKNGGLDQYGTEPFEQQQFGTAAVEGVTH